MERISFCSFVESILATMAGEREIGRSSAKFLASVDPFGPYALMAEFFLVWIAGDFRRMSELASKLAKLEPENAVCPTIAAHGELLWGITIMRYA